MVLDKDASAGGAAQHVPVLGEHRVALLTGGGDRPYAYGLTTALAETGICLDVVAGNELDCPELRTHGNINFLNLRGDQSAVAGLFTKVRRLSVYYFRLLAYAATARARIFHLLWNNKLELFDRTILMLCYRMLGRKIALTVHNVNAGARDGNDTVLNRLSLRAQYRLADHIFVHTDRMKQDMVSRFGVPDARITVIPFGINNAVPHTPLTRGQARRRLGLADQNRTILFFGTIAPYKGLEYLATAFTRLASTDPRYRLVIAGRPRRGSEAYWNSVAETLSAPSVSARVIQRIEFIPDTDTELYFKAADLAVLPYTDIFQSGVLFLAYSFGVPVVAADVGSLKEDVREGETGFVCRPRDATDLAGAIERYFASSLYASLAARQPDIRYWAREHHSWDTVARLTTAAYAELLKDPAMAVSETAASGR